MHLRQRGRGLSYAKIHQKEEQKEEREEEKEDEEDEEDEEEKEEEEEGNPRGDIIYPPKSANARGAGEPRDSGAAASAAASVSTKT